MKSIGEHISLLRGLVENYASGPYTDEYLYGVLSICRSEVIKQRLDKFVNISYDNWVRLCIQLEVTTSHNCNCVPDYISCKVLRTKYKIPQVISGRNKAKVNVMLLDGTNINVVTEAEWMRIKENSFKSKFYYASFVNGYLYFWNLPLNLKVVQVTGIFDSIDDLQKIQCGTEEQSPCFDMKQSPFPIDGELTSIMYKKALELLSVPEKMIQDVTNDSNEQIKQ